MSILAKDHSDPGTYLESVGERILGEVLNRLPKTGSRPYLDPLLRDYPERGREAVQAGIDSSLLRNDGRRSGRCGCFCNRFGTFP